MAPLRYGRPVLERIAALCEAEPEREACGLVVERSGTLEVLPVPNVARVPAHAFELDPSALLGMLRALDADGGRVAAIWHSHVDAPAALSAEDRAGALEGGAPLFPGAEQLVFAVRGGRVVEARRWVLERGGFFEAPLEDEVFRPRPPRGA